MLRRGSRRRLAAAVALTLCVALALGTAASGAVRGNPAAAKQVLGAIEEKFPDSTQRFVNCPPENTTQNAEGWNEIVCEFRVVDHDATVRGSAGVASERTGWVLAGFYPGRPLPHRWLRCATGSLKGLPGSNPRRLAVYGEPCLDAKMMAGTIQYRASRAPDRRLPRHFVEAWYGTNTLGFVLNTFRCRGRVQPHHGHRRETAECGNGFGDRFTYVFDQYS